MLGVRRPVTILVVAIAMLAASARALAATPQQTLARALAAGINDAGSASGALVVDLTTGQTLYSYKPTTGRLPASVEKLYTTSTALLRLGPSATLTTRVLGVGYRNSKGTWHGTLYLKGGGDPTFGWSYFDRANYGGAGATIEQLVSNLVRTNGIKAVQGRIVGDGSYFDSHRGTPATGMAASIWVEGVLDGLSFDRGWLDSTGTVYQSSPSLYAARQFAAALRDAGVRVPASVKISARGTPSSARQLATVHSPSIGRLLQLTNTPSDNYLAEMLLKVIGARLGGSGTTAAGAAVVRSEVASAFGITPRLNDGSGLSLYDSTSPKQVVKLLAQMASNPTFTRSLAVAGETGTLQPVDPNTIARGRCRGKTGTLANVANTAGYCQARDGHTLAFAFLVNGNSATGYVHNVVEADMMTALARYNG
jgi:D-alanyl-D-alanine carboxypeptidase/D-alanyl-D-alanine-endopeptidase (penicillin-binding protein 4)